MLEVWNLTKRFATPRGPLTVLSDVSFSLKTGEAAAIMGPSGTGKSSLLYILGNLESATSGTVAIHGRSPTNAEIGFVFQDHCLLPQCSVLENVLVPTLVAPPDNYGERAKKLIEQVGLKDRIEHRPGELSGGEKQRVAIARALIRRPGLVLCDEPTGNLDAVSAANVTSLLLDLHREQNNILIVVTHSDRVASEFPIRFQLVDGQLKRV